MSAVSKLWKEVVEKQRTQDYYRNAPIGPKTLLLLPFKNPNLLRRICNTISEIRLYVDKENRGEVTVLDLQFPPDRLPKIFKSIKNLRYFMFQRKHISEQFLGNYHDLLSRNRLNLKELHFDWCFS